MAVEVRAVVVVVTDVVVRVREAVVREMAVVVRAVAVVVTVTVAVAMVSGAAQKAVVATAMEERVREEEAMEAERDGSPDSPALPPPLS